MVVKIDSDALMDSMKELCAVFLNQPAYKELRQMIDQFSADSEAIKQYEQFVDKHEQLSQQERQGIEIHQDEIEAYNQEELKLYDNPVIRRFMYAQREFNKSQQFVSQYFAKTIELKRVPEQHDLESNGSCGCGGSCGCSH